MKFIKKKTTYMIILALIGVSFIIMGIFKADGNLLRSMGVGLAAVSLLKIVQYNRIAKDPEKVRELEIVQNEERLVFIATKACAYTFYGIVIAEYLALLFCMFTARESLATIISFIVCAELLLYLVIYMGLKKKY